MILKVGAVYLSSGFVEVKPAGEKWAICVSSSKGWFFSINTANRAHYDCIGISALEHPMLKTDRFVSCSNVLTLDLEKEFTEKYTISDNFKKALIQKIQSSSRLDRVKIDIILTELK